MEMVEAKQYGERVNIVKYIRVEKKWRFAAVVEKRGRVIRDQVWIARRKEHHPEGRYFLEWYQGGKRCRHSVGGFENVIDGARRKAIELGAIKAGLIRPQAEQSCGDEIRINIATAIDSYLDLVKHHRSLRTYRTYRYTLDTLLRHSYAKEYVDQVERQDILNFMTDCYKQGLGSRTVYEKLVVVLQLFKRHGKTKLIESNDWPDYVDTIRPIYEADEIGTMLEHADPNEGVFLKFLLASGFRDREVRHVTWRDMDFRNSSVRVTAKPLWGFGPKAGRSVPCRCLRHSWNSCKNSENRNALPSQLVFPNSRGNPDSENDMIVKPVATRAKLSCGQCVTKHGNKCAQGPYCRHFFLHKFRHTFATEHLRHGVDIRTLQSWMGHRDTKSTMVYLKSVQSKNVSTANLVCAAA
jgi:integrase/recombinase XerD